MTALSHAVRWGHLQLADDLLKAGSNVNMTEHRLGHSLLMMASVEGNIAMVELLLQWGAETSYQTVLGDTAVSVAQAMGHDHVAQHIIRSSASVPSALAAPARVKQLLEQKKLSASQNPASLSKLLADLGMETRNYSILKSFIEVSYIQVLKSTMMYSLNMKLIYPCY